MADSAAAAAAAAAADPFAAVEACLKKSAADLWGEALRAGGHEMPPLSAAPARNAAHGDIALNAGLVLAKLLRRKPMELAEDLQAKAAHWPGVVRADCAPPGFVNLTLSAASWQASLREILHEGKDWARARPNSAAAISLEYVSANPTGPLHIGHARGAVVGDALANLLAYAGHKVRRDYYINDAGGQIEALAASLHWRLREAKGERLGAMPSDFYPGAYLQEMAAGLLPKLPAKFWEWEEARRLPWLAQRAVAQLMDAIKADLRALGIAHDCFFSEQGLRARKLPQAIVQELKDKGLVYQGVLPLPKSGKRSEEHVPLPQTLFRARQFGDDEDRALCRPDGAWTYFAVDLACHREKFGNEALELINVWGADHGGYVKRLQLALQALHGERLRLEVKLCHLVRLWRDGAQVRMSKRGGEFIALREVLEEVGKDVLRFMMLTRRNDAPLDFDFSLLQQKSKDNPVFYVQYAHARICSVLRQAQAQGWRASELAHPRLADAPLEKLAHASELFVIKQLALFPRLVRQAAAAREPHRLAFYAYELASRLHALWTAGKEEPDLRFLHADKKLSQARLALLQATAFILKENLAMMGIAAAEEMR